MHNIYNPKLIKVIFALARRGYLDFLSDEYYLKIVYFLWRREKINFSNPQTFSEKIQWLKVNNRNLEMSTLVDKYEVREYIKKSIGEEYLVPLVGCYEHFDQIDFDKLPERFVLKTTHGSSQNLICKNKNNIDKNQAKKNFDKWLTISLYKIFREWAYKYAKPRIICEEFLGDDENVPTDYKFYCFNGKPKFIQVNVERFTDNHTETYYDLTWNRMDFYYGVDGFNGEIEKPENFDKMLEIVNLLSKKHKFVRVDLYNLSGKIYFGELTFYPASGLEIMKPEKLESIFGDYIDISK
ncbi:glycosyl transferase [Photobacterium carnosum]|uniref:ATP-grasp fold amidoligase family protein n=1 Tax=Photobacterium carnosum TaxID=2023717 RepID=UPI001E4E1F07|nr:ATP-grasp fold amidoligase family protein [Photobacterium carnosum]MCD9546746.1 glycosyl transferase [Photobacterium carnosum]